MKAKAVLWDMDGTLIDSEPTAMKAMKKALENVGITVRPEFFEDAIGMAADEIFEVLKQDYDFSFDPIIWEQIKHRNYLDLIHEVTTYPDALKLWSQLQMTGIKQAIVTNSDRIITDANLQRIGLSIPGLITVTRNDVVQGKPHPEPYTRAMKLLGMSPHECVVVEDSSSGANSGIAAGMQVVLVPQSQLDGSQGSPKLDSMKDLPNYLN